MGAAEMEGTAEGAAEMEGTAEGAVEGTAEGANDGLLVDLPFFFFFVSFFSAAFFLAALAVVGLDDAVGFKLTVGWFVGLLVFLSPFFFVFCRRLSVILPPGADAPISCCASEV